MKQALYPNLTCSLNTQNITYSQLAKAIGMSKTAIYRRKNGLIEWKLPEIVRICQFLGIEDAVWLFLRFDDKS